MVNHERIISEHIRIERIKQNFTQEEFSEEIGISTNFLYRIEAGTASMSLKTLMRIKDVLGVDGNALLGAAGEGGEYPKHFEEVLQILSDCDDREARIFISCMKYLKSIFREVINQSD